MIVDPIVSISYSILLNLTIETSLTKMDGARAEQVERDPGSNLVPVMDVYFRIYACCTFIGLFSCAELSETIAKLSSVSVSFETPLKMTLVNLSLEPCF